MRRLLLALAFVALAVLPARAADTDVAIRNFAFSPSSVTIAPGDSVTWTNHDAGTHTVTGDSDLTFRSGSLNQGATFDHTFRLAGSYPYRCDFHQAMRGTVVVQAGGGSATTPATTEDAEDESAAPLDADDDDTDGEPTNAGPAAVAALLLAAVSGSAALAVRKGL